MPREPFLGAIFQKTLQTLSRRADSRVTAENNACSGRSEGRSYSLRSRVQRQPLGASVDPLPVSTRGTGPVALQSPVRMCHQWGGSHTRPPSEFLGVAGASECDAHICTLHLPGEAGAVWTFLS